MQNKLWNPGKEELKNDEDNAAYGQQKNIVWDPRVQRLEAHDQEIMINFYFGSLMQEHPAQKFHCNLVDIGGLVFSKKLVSYVTN